VAEKLEIKTSKHIYQEKSTMCTISIFVYNTHVFAFSPDFTLKCCDALEIRVSKQVSKQVS